MQVGQLIKLDQLFEFIGQLRLVPIGGQHEQADHRLARLAFGPCRCQPLPGLAVHGTREHRVAQHPACERAGLASERGHQMPVVDVARVALPVAVRRTRALEHTPATEPAFDVLCVLPHHQAVTDELARGAVLRTLDGEDGVLAHPCRQFLVLGGAARW